MELWNSIIGNRNNRKFNDRKCKLQSSIIGNRNNGKCKSLLKFQIINYVKRTWRSPGLLAMKSRKKSWRSRLCWRSSGSFSQSHTHIYIYLSISVIVAQDQQWPSSTVLIFCPKQTISGVLCSIWALHFKKTLTKQF